MACVLRSFMDHESFGRAVAVRRVRWRVRRRVWTVMRGRSLIRRSRTFDSWTIWGRRVGGLASCQGIRRGRFGDVTATFPRPVASADFHVRGVMITSHGFGFVMSRRGGGIMRCGARILIITIGFSLTMVRTRGGWGGWGGVMSPFLRLRTSLLPRWGWKRDDTFLKTKIYRFINWFV